MKMISSYYFFVVVITWLEYSNFEGKRGCYIYFILIHLIYFAVLATSCWVKPSEYSYRADSVTRSESASNCRSYPDATDLQTGVSTKDYINCSGAQLKLTDSNLGQEKYNDGDYYEWPPESSNSQLLFVFPTRVNLTTITLHYYSDSAGGLPRLRFFSVPDDFDVWDALPSTYTYVEVAAMSAHEGLTGHTSFKISVSFNTARVLMYNFISSL